MRHHSRVELLGKLAPQRSHAQRGVALDLLRQCLVVDRFDGLAQLVLEVLEQRVQLALELLRPRLLLRASLDLNSRLLPSELLLAQLQRLRARLRPPSVAREAGRGSAPMSAVCVVICARAAATISLRRPSRSAMFNPAEAPGTPSRSSYVGESVCLVESDSSIQHTRMVSRIDLQRRKVRRDAAPRVMVEEVRQQSQPPAPRPLQDRSPSPAHPAARASQT